MFISIFVFSLLVLNMSPFLSKGIRSSIIKKFSLREKLIQKSWFRKKLRIILVLFSLMLWPGVPQDLILGHLLFNMYKFPLGQNKHTGSVSYPSLQMTLSIMDLCHQNSTVWSLWYNQTLFWWTVIFRNLCSFFCFFCFNKMEKSEQMQSWFIEEHDKISSKKKLCYNNILEPKGQN